MVARYYKMVVLNQMARSGNVVACLAMTRLRFMDIYCSMARSIALANSFLMALENFGCLNPYDSLPHRG